MPLGFPSRLFRDWTCRYHLFYQLTSRRVHRRRSLLRMTLGVTSRRRPRSAYRHHHRPRRPTGYRHVGALETIKVKVGNGKRARTKSETALEIQFSGLVAGTGELAAYQLSSVTTKKVKKKFVTSYKPIRLTSAVPASNPYDLDGFAFARNQAKPLAERSNPDHRGRPHQRLRPPAPSTATTTACPAAISWRPSAEAA
jgi:hypothetical protein